MTEDVVAVAEKIVRDCHVGDVALKSACQALALLAMHDREEELLFLRRQIRVEHYVAARRPIGALDEASARELLQDLAAARESSRLWRLGWTALRLWWTTLRRGLSRSLARSLRDTKYRILACRTPSARDLLNEEKQKW